MGDLGRHVCSAFGEINDPTDDMNRSGMDREWLEIRDFRVGSNSSFVNRQKRTSRSANRRIQQGGNHSCMKRPSRILQRMLRLKLDRNFAGLGSDVMKADQARYRGWRELAITNRSHAIEYRQSIGLLPYFSRILAFTDPVSCVRCTVTVLFHS